MRPVVHTLRGLGTEHVPPGSFPAPRVHTPEPPPPVYLGASVEPPFVAPPVFDDQPLRVDLPRTSWLPAVAIFLGVAGILTLIVASLLPSSPALGLARDGASERVAPVAPSADVGAENGHAAPRVTPGRPARPAFAAPAPAPNTRAPAAAPPQPRKGAAAPQKSAAVPSKGAPASKAKTGSAKSPTQLYGRR